MDDTKSYYKFIIKKIAISENEIKIIIHFVLAAQFLRGRVAAICRNYFVVADWSESYRSPGCD